MRPLALIGVILIVLGVAGLVVGRISFTTEKKVVDLGPIEASKKEQHNIDVPDIAAVIAVLAGGFLVYVGRRRA
jgi:hypothetical protein